MDEQIAPPRKPRRFSGLQVCGIVAAVALVSGLFTAWWVKHTFYASPFSPTELSMSEKKVLNEKLRLMVRGEPDPTPPKTAIFHDVATPEPYSEEGAGREIRLTEKELNGLIARDPARARRVAIDLDRDQLSIIVLLPLKNEVPVLGGTTLRIHMGLKLAYENHQPVVALRGVTMGGVPLPNAWLGNLKHTNLVEEFGSEDGFWRLFADGVADIQVSEGYLMVRLKE